MSDARREGTFASPAGAGFPGLKPAPDDASGHPREPLAGRLGLTVPHEWWPSAHLLKSFEAAGFSYAQVDSPPISVLRSPRLCIRHAVALKEALTTTGLAAILHAPAGLRLGAAPGDRAIDGLIEYAAEVGASQIVYHALAIPDEPESEDRLRFEVRALARAARRAADLNLRIAVENLAPLYPGPETLSSNPMSLRGLAHRLDSDGIGVCLDLGHAHVVADLRRTSLERFVEPVLDVVTLFHAHDNFGARRGAEHGDALGVDPLRLDLHLPPGRGSLPWHAIGPLISAHRAPVVLEVHPPYRPRAAELREDAALLLSA
jgi:sugar phosphate isomerase/epimerase